ncbi:MAG: hypothetical protein AUI15_23605 [Actinobacteria bacterium 13_2_20CM_2_66_6]|nr:MAG: hypothetical protein AUI15_23605 [Actinobacteria bacterium 13_2_20CM_2_66_6]
MFDGSVDARATSVSSFAMPEHCRSTVASLAVVNGRVWRRPGATAVVLDGDRIAAVGAGRFDAARVIDAEGAWILPAFNDAHVHFLMASRSLGELDLFGIETQPELELRVAGYARGHDGPWVVGRGWFYSAFPEGMPTVELLDRLVPDRPAYLESFDAHTGWANSRALAIAGVTTRDVLREAALLAVTRVMPIPTRELRLAFDLTPGRDFEVYARLRQDDDPWVSTGILKAFADGVVESKTAAMLHPYAGSDERGDPIWGPDELREAVHAADARGWQVQVHAIGDAAIRQALDAFEGTTPGRRHRVEHIESPDPADIPRFARLGVIASMQPQHAAPAMVEVWRRHLGPERAARGWPWKAIKESGARLAFGTDWPVVPLDPMASIAEAMRDLSLEDAVDAWTAGGAFAEHAESRKGELREGLAADIAIVDFESAQVKATVVGGRLVYEG